MDHIYAGGVSIIGVIQQRFQVFEGYFHFINRVASPAYPQEYLFPFVSVFDSVFSAQLLLCTSLGGWINSIMKWWLLEHRPYWWVRETGFYCDCATKRPSLRQTKQTCETGPGCPSGHTQSAAIMLVLATCWISHYLTDRKLDCITCWKYPWYTLCAFLLGSVMFARVYVAAHFPHQVLLGALLGVLLTPFLCIYVLSFVWQYGYHSSTPVRCAMIRHFAVALATLLIGVLLTPFLCIYVLSFVWQYGYHSSIPVPCAMVRHFAVALATLLIGTVTNLSLTWGYGTDDQWFEKMAQKNCEHPEDIHKGSKPMYALVYDTGHLLGWALFVTPSVSKYRHYTKNRSLVIALFSIKCLNYILLTLHHKLLNNESDLKFYICLFILCAVRVPLILRVPPLLAMWPYKKVFSRKQLTKINKKHNKKR